MGECCPDRLDGSSFFSSTVSTLTFFAPSFFIPLLKTICRMRCAREVVSGNDRDDFQIASFVFAVNEHAVAPAFEK
jgi:hypothetical protein